MPGMMETVLDVGLNDESVHGLARHGGERFAQDSYRRLIQMFGSTVLGIDSQVFGDALSRLKLARGRRDDTELDDRGPAGPGRRLPGDRARARRPQLPPGPTRTARPGRPGGLRLLAHAYRAQYYRRHEGIDENLGTAVNIQAMVFGNRGPDSGSGVCFTRDPATGARGVYGDYLEHAQGEDVVAGIRNTVPLSDLAEIDKVAYDELLGFMSILEGHYRDMCDIEFTIEDGRLWMLQTRVGKRTAQAAFRVAHAMVGEGLITPRRGPLACHR